MILISVNNKIDLSTLTGGEFNSLFPRDNIKTPILSKSARTTSITSFTLTATLPSNHNIGCVAIAGHNLSRTATFRVKTYLSTTLENDSGNLSAWYYLASDDLYWSNGDTFSASIASQDRIDKSNPTAVYYLPTNTKASKVEITFTDTDNQDGYIEIGRVFIGEVINPQYNVEYGDLSYGLKNLSKISLGDNGIKYARNYPILRTVVFNWKDLGLGEGITAYRAQYELGLTGEVVTTYSLPTYTDISGTKTPDSNWFMRAFLGNFAELDKLTYPYFNRHGAGVSIEEVAR